MISKENVSFSAFYERYSSLDDVKLMDILRNRKDYRDTAIEAAVKIATERGLIYSEEDLLAPEFQNGGERRFSIFPDVPHYQSRNRLESSVFRFLFIYSALPIVFGALQFAKGNLAMAVSGFVVAAVWIALVAFLKKWQAKVAIILLYFIVVGVVLFAGYRLAVSPSTRFVDYFILTIAFALPLYFLTLAGKIISRK